MKIKANLYISNPEYWAKHPGDCNAYALQSGRFMDKDWTFCGEVEFDVDVDTGKVIKAAQKGLDAEIGKHTAAINLLENRKNDLLAIEYKS